MNNNNDKIKKINHKRNITNFINELNKNNKKEIIKIKSLKNSRIFKLLENKKQVKRNIIDNISSDKKIEIYNIFQYSPKILKNDLNSISERVSENYSIDSVKKKFCSYKKLDILKKSRFENLSKNNNFNLKIKSMKNFTIKFKNKIKKNTFSFNNFKTQSKYNLKTNIVFDKVNKKFKLSKI